MSYPESVWQPVQKVGSSSNNNSYSYIAQGGYMVKSIGFYTETKPGWWGVRGLSIKFTDGKSFSAGTLEPENSLQEFLFQPGEKVTECSIWVGGNKSVKALGRFYLKTSKNRTFDAGLKDTKTAEQKIDVGSGYFLGVAGACGADVDSLGAVFMKPVSKAFIDNVNYPNLDPNDTSFFELRSLDTATYKWSGKPYTQAFAGSKSVAITTTWNTKNTVEFGVEATVKAGIPFVAGEQLGLSFKYGHQSDKGGSTTETDTLTWTTTVQVQSKDDEVVTSAEYYEGNLSTDYTGTYNFVTEDGAKHSWPITGTLETVLRSQVTTYVKPLNGNGEKRAVPQGSVIGGRSLDPQYNGNEEGYKEQRDGENWGQGDEQAAENEGDEDTRGEDTVFNGDEYANDEERNYDEKDEEASTNDNDEEQANEAQASEYNEEQIDEPTCDQEDVPKQQSYEEETNTSQDPEYTSELQNEADGQSYGYGATDEPSNEEEPVDEEPVQQDQERSYDYEDNQHAEYATEEPVNENPVQQDQEPSYGYENNEDTGYTTGERFDDQPVEQDQEQE